MRLGYGVYKDYLNEVLRAVITDFGKQKILAFAVFGSVARGEATPDSDLDIFILHKEVSFNPVSKFVDILLRIEEGTEHKKLKAMGLNPDPYAIFMTENEIARNPLILLDVLDHGIILYDKANRLKKMLSRLEERLRELGAKRVELKNGSWYWDLKPDWKPGEVIEIQI